MADLERTSYGQSLTHLIKGNLGAGLLGMGRSFAHLGLVSGVLVLPAVCIICCYCVHLLVRSVRLVQAHPAGSGSGATSAGRPAPVRAEIDYPSLARCAFAQGPEWARRLSGPFGHLVDTTLLVTQMGICCVYVVFVVENVISVSGPRARPRERDRAGQRAPRPSSARQLTSRAHTHSRFGLPDTRHLSAAHLQALGLPRRPSRDTFA